ncbi:MAG: NAD(P)H-hydrate epimerase [Vicinamibacterales bacterium]|nr:NAD(P)H-hydrate epimerase [Vicinamibacterales bacterium]
MTTGVRPLNPAGTALSAIPLWSPVEPAAVPSVDAAQMAEVDRAMFEDYGIVLVQMMEHAGRHLAHLARARFLAGDARGRPVVVLAGKGGNGGGALVAARRLAGWGADVSIAVTADDEAFVPASRLQLGIARRLDLPVVRAADLGRLARPDLIIDGVIGYRLHGAPGGEAARLIAWAAAAAAPILALDIPSGLDATTGMPGDPVIEAAATMTLALPKRGLSVDTARRYVGELYLADIGVPPALYARAPLGLVVPPVFAACDLVRLR